MSNWELQDDEVDFKESFDKLKSILINMSAKDFVIMLMLLMMLLMYVIHIREIESCNAFFNELIRNKSLLPLVTLW